MKHIMVFGLSTLLLLGACSSSAPANTSSTGDTAQQPIVETTGTITTEIPATTYTMADVAAHATEESCWTAIDGAVYDLSAFFGEHPGGDRNILKLCGMDGTSAFEGKHGGEDKPEKTLEGFRIGALA